MPIVCGECHSERVNVTKNGKVYCLDCGRLSWGPKEKPEPRRPGKGEFGEPRRSA